jgi:dolichol-phosphate mannosyltransferase
MKNEENFSIVIPTFQEAKNIPDLIDRISKVDFAGRTFEVLIIDDRSEDGSVEIVERLRAQYPWLRMIVREAKRDLSQSVIDGFHDAKYPILVTLDADLSHPPEKLPEILEALSQPGVEVVLGSRYVPGGSMDEVWPLSRKIVSRLAAWVARVLLGVRLKDPLSGLVAIRKNTLLAGDPLSIIGWKWGLEIMIKCHCKKVVEVPIHFSQRKYGSSKLNFKIAMNYFQHIKRLAIYKMLK